MKNKEIRVGILICSGLVLLFAVYSSNGKSFVASDVSDTERILSDTEGTSYDEEEKNLDDINCEDVLKSLKDGGVPISYSLVYDERTDPNNYTNGEHEYLQKAGFVDERVDREYDRLEPRSGTIEVFSTNEKARSRAIDLFISKSDRYAYRILSDNVLLRLSRKYTEEQAQEIADVIGGDIHSKDEEPIAAYEKFGDVLDSFQGEWKMEDDPMSHLIIRYDKIYALRYFTYGRDVYEDDCEEYKFGFDEEQNLVVVIGEHPVYVYTINENGQLVALDIMADSSCVYEKVSDIREIPQIKKRMEPQIGMTENEVYDSTWGSPKKINKTETVNGIREQWVYEDGYIYFDNGYVTLIQKY